VKQHREPAAALNERPDRGAPQAEDEVALPVTGNGTVLSLGGTLTDHDLLAHEALSAPGAGSRDAQRPSGPQASCQLAPQRAAALHIERLVDHFVGDTHRFIIGEVKAETVRDLLRAP
jgi:hypothetical protein